MLDIEDQLFWENITPFEFGDIPVCHLPYNHSNIPQELQDDVTVIGYPTGGDNISGKSSKNNLIQSLQ